MLFIIKINTYKMYFESNLNNFILIHLIFLLGKTDVGKFLKNDLT